MSLQAALIFLGFICIFHAIGGAVVGAFFRHLRRGGSWGEFTRLVWGLAAGGLPLIFGIITFADAGMLHWVAVEVLVFVAAIFVVAFFPETFADPLRSPQVSQIFFGGVFFAVGALVAVRAFREQEFLIGLIGVVFVGAGVLLIVAALKKLLNQ